MSKKAGVVAIAVTLAIALAVALCVGAIVVNKHKPIVFESAESKTIDGQPVFNEISFYSSPKKQVWVMRQSHIGLQIDKKKWDRLAIVVDTTRPIKTAKFFQFEPGQNGFDETAKQVPFRAACFMCHANGPRAIRPNLTNPNLPVSWSDRLRIAWWNLQMTRLGRVEPHQNHITELLKPGSTPFRFQKTGSNDKLSVGVCSACHNDSSASRGNLVRQQVASIDFLVRSKAMPPSGFQMTKNDATKLRRFLKGF